MGAQSTTITYPRLQRLGYFSGLGLCPICVAISIYFGIWGYQRTAPLWPYAENWIDQAQLAGGAVVLALLTLMYVPLFWVTCGNRRYLLLQYQFDGTTLTAYDPLLRKRRSITLREVRTIRDSLVGGRSASARDNLIHDLISHDGATIRISEALPTWPEIRKACINATEEIASYRWWQFSAGNYRAYLNYLRDVKGEEIAAPAPDPIPYIEGGISVHPAYIRRAPICLLVVAGMPILRGRAQIAAKVYRFGWKAAEDIFAFLAAALCMAAILTWILRPMWLYLYRYRLNGSMLEVIFPIFRRRLQIDLREVRVIRSFAVRGAASWSPVCRGHELVAGNNHKLRLTEALPIWPVIQERCPSATWEEPLRPWWKGAESFQKYRQAEKAKAMARCTRIEGDRIITRHADGQWARWYAFAWLMLLCKGILIITRPGGPYGPSSPDPERLRSYLTAWMVMITLFSVGIIAAMVAVLLQRYLLQRYALRGSQLDILDWRLHRRYALDLSTVRKVTKTLSKRVDQSGGFRDEYMLAVYDLIGPDGRRVRLSEALPNCREILEKCVNAEFIEKSTKKGACANRPGMP